MAYRIALSAWILSSFSLFSAAPDLQPWGPATRPYVDYATFAADSCEVREGCTSAGTRRLLRFETESRNYGTADLVFGDPSQNPRFVWDPCHNHYHFGQFTVYRLLNQSGGVVVQGNKIGFCLEDTLRWDPNVPDIKRYNCNYQGIQRGFADRYTYNVPCQFIDITGVPAGTYILDITIDPLNLIPELNDFNNNVQVTVQIPPEACTVPPGNDNYPNAYTIASGPAVVNGNNGCATKQPWEPAYDGNSGGRSVWWRWVAPATRQVIVHTEGSSFDTLLAVFHHVPGQATLLAANDDVVRGVIQHSEVRFNAVAGNEYRFVVDGFDGASGSITLTVDPPGNDDFSACRSLTAASGTLSAHNIGATREPNEPTHAATFGSHSVWYCWTAPRSGLVEWSTMGSDFDTTLAIYRGTVVSNLTHVASDNDSGSGGTSITRFSATSNTVYRIAVDGRGDASGNITLRWNYVTGRLAIRRNSNGTLTLTVTGVDGTYTLQASTSLTNWSNVGTVTVTNGTGSTTQQNNTSRRFYRAILPTQ